MITKVSKDLCISCGICPAISPDLYKMDKDDKAIVLKGELADNELIEANEAVDSCPTNAITVEN